MSPITHTKPKPKVLLLENIHPLAEQVFRAQGFDVEALQTSLSPEELIDKLKDVTIIGIRSNTRITAEVLEHATQLRAIGAFCIGTNQIDLAACSNHGIAVFNAPYSNARSVIELVMGLIVMLSRGIFDKSSALHRGEWHKSANGFHEIRGKKLGIIGYGNIGMQLSTMAENMGMDVCFYDIVDRPALGNARHCATMDEVLASADVISMHVDGRPYNVNLIGEREFSRMKKGVLFINLSRGSVVDIDALAHAIQNKTIAGAAIDVFPKEPSTKDAPMHTPLQGLHNVILTPHIGGSTEEAQQHIGQFVASKISSFIHWGDTTLSVNFPSMHLPHTQHTHRVTHMHRNVPGVMAHINEIFAAHNINIDGQTLATRDVIGYAIIDVHGHLSSSVISALKDIPETIRVHAL